MAGFLEAKRIAKGGNYSQIKGLCHRAGSGATIRAYFACKDEIKSGIDNPEGIDMQGKRWIGAAVVAAVLAAVSSYASPYWDLYRMRAAVQARDADAVSARVDFPALRENIKGQLMIAMQKRMPGAPANDNPLAALGQAMAVALVNPMIDAMISPAGVMAMLESGEARPAPPGVRPGGADKADQHDWTLRYRNWNQVAVTADAPGGGSFIFRRDGLWSWKLAALELPADLPTASP